MIPLASAPAPRMPSQLDRLRDRRAAGASAAGGEAAPRTIVVAGGKGGTGTTVVAALAALAAYGRGERVLLVDADDQVGPLALLLGCVAPDARLDDFLRGRCAPEQVLAWLDTRVALLPGGLPADRALPPLAGAERRSAFRRVATLGQAFDRVVIDAGARLDGVLAATAARADAVLLVTAPDAIATAAAYAVAKVLVQHAPGLALGAIANRAGREEGETLLAQLGEACERFLGTPLLPLGTVPTDDAFDRALRAGLPLAEAAHGAPVARAVADCLTPWLAPAASATSTAARRSPA